MRRLRCAEVSRYTIDIQKIAYFTYSAVSGCIGIALTIYGFLEWKANGFPIIAKRSDYFFQQSGSSGEWSALCLIGIGLFVYCLFGAMNRITYCRRDGSK